MGMGTFFGAKVFQKGAFCLLAPTNQVSFLTFANEIFFLENQGTRLGVIIASNKGLEQALDYEKNFQVKRVTYVQKLWNNINQKEKCIFFWLGTHFRVSSGPISAAPSLTAPQ